MVGLVLGIRRRIWQFGGVGAEYGGFGSPILMLLICMCRSEGIQKYKAIRCRALFFLRPSPDGHYRDCIKSMDSVLKIRNSSQTQEGQVKDVVLRELF